MYGVGACMGTRTMHSEFITHSLESTWTLETVIMEGMFIINTKPLNCHRTMEECGHFLTRTFHSTLFQQGKQRISCYSITLDRCMTIQSYLNKQEETHLFRVTTCAGSFLMMLRFQINGMKCLSAVRANAS